MEFYSLGVVVALSDRLVSIHPTKEKVMYRKFGIATLISIIVVSAVAFGRKIRSRQGELTVVTGQ